MKGFFLQTWNISVGRYGVKLKYEIHILSKHVKDSSEVSMWYLPMTYLFVPSVRGECTLAFD